MKNNIVHHIKKIRRQPEEVRMHILHVLTVIFGVILISLWVYSLGANFTSTESKAKEEDSIKPFSSIKENIVGGYNSISSPQ